MPGDIAPTWRGGRAAPIEVGILPDLPGYPTNPANVLYSFFGGLGQNDIVNTASLTQYFADAGGLPRIGPMMGARGFPTSWGFVITPQAIEMLRQATGTAARSGGGGLFGGGGLVTALELTTAIGVPAAMTIAAGGATYMGINHAAGLYERAASGGRIGPDGSVVIVSPFGGAHEVQLLPPRNPQSFDDPLNGIEIRGPDEADFARDLASRGYSGGEIQSRLNEFRRSGYSGVFGQGPLSRSTLSGLVSDATMNPDSTTLVLGRWWDGSSRYTDAAAHFGATYFKMDNSVYFSLTGEQRWQVNQAFLDRQISQGKDIILSHDPTRALPTSTFGREVQYLRDYGYEFHQDTWFWRARLGE